MLAALLKRIDGKMASVVASNVVNRVFGWVKQKNIRLIFDVSLLRRKNKD